MTFSARSLGLARNCCSRAASSCAVAPRAAVPFIGLVRMVPTPSAPARQSKNSSGETDKACQSPMSSQAA